MNPRPTLGVLLAIASGMGNAGTPPTCTITAPAPQMTVPASPVLIEYTANAVPGLLAAHYEYSAGGGGFENASGVGGTANPEFINSGANSWQWDAAADGVVGQDVDFRLTLTDINSETTTCFLSLPVELLSYSVD